MIKLNIHSIVSRITNSSTVIYTYQNSTNEAKELLQEILNIYEPDKKVDDLFYFGTFCDNDIYADRFEELDEDDKSKGFPEDWQGQKEYVQGIKTKIIKGEIEKPEWMKDIEEESEYSFPPDLYLNILSKDEKYNSIVEKMLAFLNSVDADGGYDG